jgi:ABC-2 type transport system permease protein
LRKLINLVKNENMKLTRKTSTWIMVGILVFLVGFVGVMGKYQESKHKPQDWKKAATAEMMSAKKMLDAGKTKGMSKDETAYFEKRYAMTKYSLDNNISPMEEFSVWGMVDNTTGLVTLIALFAIVFGGGIIANEFGEGTIKLLLIRPAKRWKILLSKYISVVSMALFMLIVLFISSFLIGGVLFGFGGIDQPYLNYHNGIVEQTNIFAHTLSVYGFDCINLLMMVTLAFMISTVFRSSSLAIGIGVFLMFAGNMIVMILSNFEWSRGFVKYILFANVDLTQYISGTPVIEGMTMTFSIIVLVVYYCIFQFISFFGFAKRDVAA